MLFCFITSMRLHVPIPKLFFWYSIIWYQYQAIFLETISRYWYWKQIFQHQYRELQKIGKHFKTELSPSPPTDKTQTDESFFYRGASPRQWGRATTSSVCLLNDWDTISCKKSILRLPTEGRIKALSKSWRYNFKYGPHIQFRRWQNFEKNICLGNRLVRYFFWNFVTFVDEYGSYLKFWSRQIMFSTKQLFGAKLGGTPTSYSGKNPASSICTLP